MPTARRSLPLATLGLTLLSCIAAPGPTPDPAPVQDPAIAGSSPLLGPADPAAPATVPDPRQVQLEETPPAAVLPPTDAQKRLDAALTAFLASAPTRRMYIMIDKPLYQPGETIWFSGGLVATATMIASQPGLGVTYQLVSPKGSVVLTRRVAVDAHGTAANDFVLPEEMAGGEYVIRARADDGTVDERKVIVASYEAPRLKKAIEFVKKAYGPGETVAAAVSVARGTGEPFAARPLTAVVTVDEVEVARLAFTTDGAGNGVIRFALPAQIARGDALLTVLVEDGGVTESVQKRIPVVLKTLALTLFPEGGDLIAGLPARVYFAATNPLGKPADIEGRLVNDAGVTLATFASLRDGLGRFAFTPHPGRTYRVEITRPTGIAKRFELPEIKRAGCALQAFDDPESKRDEVRIAVSCTQARVVVLEAVLRESRVASASAEVKGDAPTVISLPIPRGSQGALRVTLLSDELSPLAERLIYRGRGADLKVKVIAAKPKLTPRDPVELIVETSDLAGRPVEASVGVAVVDDTVLSFADDKTAHLLAHLYLEKELGDAPIEEPNFYFSQKPDAARALDLLMGTRGWRRFDWQMVLAPPVSGTETVARGGVAMPAAGAQPERPMIQAQVIAKPGDAPRRKEMPPPAPPMGQAMAKKPAPPLRNAGPMARPMPDEKAAFAFGLGKERRAARDDDFAGEEQKNEWVWAPVRQFPVPDYSAGKVDGPRTDFRETIYWNPSVTTGKDGRATVKFFLSDAVTSFRATVEGRSSGGLPGRGEAMLSSKLPLSLDARLPLEVSSGDTIRLPVTLTNETDHDLDATLTAKFGAAFRLDAALPARAAGGVPAIARENPASDGIKLRAGERKSLFFPITVVGMEGEGEVEIATTTGGLGDSVKRTIRVVPLGFPAHASFSGTLKDRAEHTLDLESALPRTVTAAITLYPSPLTSMQKGTEGLLREPGGCFEQTSSSNYPNVMVSQYLAAHHVADPALLKRTHGLLERGYKILAGYESPKKGYEWFGGDPGHEALTAYGIMEFEDMAKVYGDVDRTMIDRTARWLYSRRDGKGGYLRNARALDSFGGAPPDVTNGYITWALTESGKRDLAVEIEAQRKIGAESSDPYLVALAANTLFNVKDPTASSTVKRLAALQHKDGSFPGAETSITRSGGNALAIETTSLAALALMKDPADRREGELRAAAEWLSKRDNGFGAYGSTQSTVLALKALNAYSEHSRRAASDGVVTVFVNGQPAGRIAFDKGRKEALVFEDIAGALLRGKNTIEIRLASQSPLPYAAAIDWRTALPQSSPEAKVKVSATLAKGSVRMGETVRLNARIESVSAEGLPMALARIGLPGGLTFQTWQLKELREKGAIDFYETRPREVIVYFRSLAPKAKKEFSLDLTATVPGSYTAPASSAYLYYTNEFKHWAEPLRVAVTP
ncbi:MAG: hypothetical protein EXR72_16070 [Myxococcales bacterium]|nr:hypothetical protein [Myxococcales bacterium]